jgi:Arc/MetJ-type ribon-helix-helix transcriptional regulator
MKVTVSLGDHDVEFLDAYAVRVGAASRSAVIRQAVRMLRDSELRAAYEAAWSEWDASADAALWKTTASDGRSGAPQ